MTRQKKEAMWMIALVPYLGMLFLADYVSTECGFFYGVGVVAAGATLWSLWLLFLILGKDDDNT